MNLIEETRQALLKQGKKIINLSSGNANEQGIVFPEKILRNAYEDFLKKPAYKPDPKGCPEARKAVTSFYRARGLSILPGQVIITSGTSESYFHLFQYLAGSGREILFPRPSYPLFEEIARLAGIKIKFYDLDEDGGWQVDLKSLEKNISAKTAAIVLISPSNPTGAVLSENNISAVLKIARQKGCAVISDEVFSEFIFDGKSFPRVQKIARDSGIKNVDLFTLNGVSKTCALPGLKISWIIVDSPRCAEIIDQLERPVDAFLAAGQVGQAMLPCIIKNGGPFIKKFRDYVQKNRDLAVKLLGTCPGISFHYPEGGFYLFLKIEKNLAHRRLNWDDEKIVIALLKKHSLYLHPGYFYDYGHEIYLLLSLLPPPKTLSAALKKFIEFIQSL